MLTSNDIKIVSKVFNDERYPEYFHSYTIDSTSFYFSLSWSPNFQNRNFYSNNTIVWDFGDGTNFIGPSARHFYKYPDFYNLKATLFDKNGNTHQVLLTETLTASNVFPDYVYLHPLNSNGVSYFLPSGKPSNQIIVTRYNSWQNEDFLKLNNYTINLYASGSNSDYISLSSYYTNKYSHLKAYHGFFNVNDENERTILESTKTDSVSVFAVPYTTGLIDNDWTIKFDFYNENVPNSSFVGSSGTNYNVDKIYYVDQKPSGLKANDVIVLYATLDSKNFKDKDLHDKNNSSYFQFLDQGYLNLPWSGQIFKSTTNSAEKLEITSNGLTTEGINTLIRDDSKSIKNIFDIYPIKWTETKIPFVVTFKDFDNYTIKTYDRTYNYHQGNYNNQLNDINLKLVKYENNNVFELENAIFDKNTDVPDYNNGSYFAGIVSVPNESKSVAISATLKIQDVPVSRNFLIYGFLAQFGLPKIKRYKKQSVFDYSGTSSMEFYFEKEFSTFSQTTTANMHVCFSPLKFLDETKENFLFILDADNERIYKTDIDGNISSIISLSSVDYQPNENVAPVKRSFLNKYGHASPSWCCTDKNGNAYISLTDAVSSIKINYNSDIVSVIYTPQLKNLELYNESYFNDPQFMGFVGENTILPSCIDVDDKDNVYVAYTHPLSNFICKYANNGTVLHQIYFNSLEVPQEIIIDANNNIWVGIENINQSSSFNTERNDIIYFIDGKTYEKTPIKQIQGFGTMSIDASQNIYVLHKTNTISKIDATTKTKVDYNFGSTGDVNAYIKDIGGMAVDSSGELWVANNVDGLLYFADTFNLSKPLSSLPSEKLKDLELRPYQNIQAVYSVLGDWTGFRWINKFIKTVIPEPRLISGVSNVFDVFEATPTVIKKGEEFDYLTQIKSYILQESLSNKQVFLDDFIGQILGKNEKVEEIGKVIYEKISNFVSNNSDIETCNIQNIISFAEETGTNLNEYLYSYPPSIRRAMDILSICQKKLFGSKNTYNRNFALSAYEYLLNNNLGRQLNIENDKFIAGKPIVSYEIFSEKYNLITNTIVPNYSFGESVTLSSVNYNWGWGLITATKEQSGSEIGQYYNFFEYVENKEIEIYDNIINFDSHLTTISPQESSFQDWSKFGGYMDRILSYGFYKGLKLVN